MSASARPGAVDAPAEGRPEAQVDRPEVRVARCASHPSVEARFTCKRCGDFACVTCSSRVAEGACRRCEDAVAAEGEVPRGRQVLMVCLALWGGAVATPWLQALERAVASTGHPRTVAPGVVLELVLEGAMLVALFGAMRRST